jgi:hypothetical protein
VPRAIPACSIFCDRYNGGALQNDLRWLSTNIWTGLSFCSASTSVSWYQTSFLAQLHVDDSDTSIASRVRTLELLKGSIGSALSRCRCRHANPRKSPAVQRESPESRISMEVIHNLTSVTTLVIRLSSHEDALFHPLKFAILDNRWTTFAYSLRYLSLHSPLLWKT